MIKEHYFIIMIIAIVKTLFYKKYKFSDIFVYNKTYFSSLKLKTANKKEFFGPASARSYKIGVVGNNWLVGWLVGWQRSFLRNGSKDFSDFLHECRGL